MKKTVLVEGWDGYIGYALTLRLLEKGYNVIGIDNFSRRKNVKLMNSFSATDIHEPDERIDLLQDIGNFEHFTHDLHGDYDRLFNFLSKRVPDVVVNLAQQPSAPFSFRSRKDAVDTTHHNLIGTLNMLYFLKECAPESHIIQIGSMGEYDPAMGTDIPEGTFDLQLNGRIAKNVIFPRRPGSFYHACYSEDTEILTENGWISFDKLYNIHIGLNKKSTSINQKIYDLGDDTPRVATLNKNTGNLEYQRPTNVFIYEDVDEMIRIQNRSVDLLVTPNHKIFEYSNTTGDLSNWRLTEAQDLYGKSCVMKKSANYNKIDEDFILPECEVKINGTSSKIEPSKSIKKENWVRFLGWWLTEGSLYKNSIQISQHKEENFEDIKESIECLGINKKIQTNINEGKVVGFSIKSVQLSEYLKQFGLSKEKYIPREVLNNTSRENLRLLLETLIKGNGNGKIDERVSMFYTSSKRLSDDVQELCLKCGLSATINKRNETEYAISITNNDKTQFIMSESVNSDRETQMYSREYINGNVYCVEVPNSIVFVRRNGKSVWCGNSKVASTYYIDAACRWWGIRATDIMQGVVYGNWTPEIEKYKSHTRLDSDECFGTVVNRFIIQAMLNKPLTIFGDGLQSRGYLALNDSIQCLMLAIENPPTQGTYRTWNQLDEIWNIVAIAGEIKKIGKLYGLDVRSNNIVSPREERTDDFYYKPYVEKLINLGFEQTRTMEDEINFVFKTLLPIAKNELYPLENVIIPKITWK